MFETLIEIYKDSFYQISDKEKYHNPYQIYNNLKDNSFQTNKFLQNLYLNEDQREVRSSLHNSQKNENILFLKNFHLLHENIIKKGLILNYSKIPQYLFLKNLDVEDLKIKEMLIQERGFIGEENLRTTKRLKTE